MNIEELIKAIKEINPEAKTSGLKKAELEALLTELQAKATNPEQGQAAGVEGTPADPAADTSSAVVNENPALVSNSGESVNENPDAVNNSGDVVNNGNEVAMQRTPEQMAEDLKKAAFELDAIKSNESESVPRETSPEDLIKNNIAAAALTTAFYVVAEGKAITSKRGILPAGEAVEARDFVGGEETINSLLERGLVE